MLATLRRSRISNRPSWNKTVLHLIPTLEGGGAERQLSMLAAEQVRQGLNVHIGFRRAGIHGRALQNSGVKLHELGDFRRLPLQLLWNLNGLVRSIKPGVIQTWLPSMDVLGGLVAAGHRRRWLISERSSAEAYSSGHIYQARLLLSRFADGVVANSESGLQYWKNAGHNGLMHFLIPNAVAVAEIEQAPAQFPPDAASPYVLTVGRLSPEKNVRTVLKAALSMDSSVAVCFVVIGEGVERRELERQVTAAGIPGRVILLRYTENWWGMLKGAAALVNLSSYEGNPNVVLEAMASGCPLILSDIAAHRELADDNAAIFVPQGSADALVKAINHVLTDRVSANERARRARTIVANRSGSQAADLYQRVYLALACGAPGAT
jgi:glycosyltransferase involved in cell wall biosynthesis